MKIIFAMHGKPKDKRIQEIINEYHQKISRYQKIDLEYLNFHEKGFSGEKLVEKIIEKFPGSKIYFLDEDGKEFTSIKFAENYEKDLNSGEKEIVYIIGPADGFGVLPKSLHTISLSKMALQHDIAGVVLIEQIYRAVSIKNNLPYHRV